MLLWTVGPLCAGIGVVLLAFGAVSRNAAMMLLGLGYAGGGGLFMTIANALRHSSSPSSRPAVSRTDGEARRGAVFVLVLLLIGVVAAMTVHTQMRALSALRLASLQQQRAVLRFAAADAAWSFVKDTIRRSGTNDLEGRWATPQRLTLPSGQETEVAVENASVTLGPEVATMAEERLQSRLYRVAATAGASGVVESVSCFIGCRPNGAIEIMGWHEDR